MDFAKKQLEKFGWKEGTGLGKNEQGMVNAIKPTLKVGKEGMGFDYSKDLVDDWWTRAYDDSLKRIDVNQSGGEAVAVSLQEDDDNNDGETAAGFGYNKTESERPFHKMRKRMMKASFTDFAKGATLSNGQLLCEKNSDSEDDEESDKTESKRPSNLLNDDQLLKACGGRTAHKAARFGLKLNGKLARIAAQEEAAAKLFLSTSKNKAQNDASGVTSKKKAKSIIENEESKKRSASSLDVEDDSSKNSAEIVASEEEQSSKKKKKKSKKNKKQKHSDDDDECLLVNSSSSEENSQDITVLSSDAVGSVVPNDEISSPKKKKKKHNSYETL